MSDDAIRFITVRLGILTTSDLLFLGCVEIDSKKVHVVANGLTYPFGLAISQYHYYWTDWKT